MVHYQQLLGRNDSVSDALKRKLRDRLDTLLLLLPQPGQACRVLEVGCAEGHLGEALKATRSMVYDGIEISRDAETAAMRIDTVFRHPAAEVQAAPYDMVLSFHVLEHIADPAAELLQWHRLLANDGRVVLEVPNGSGHSLLASDENAEHLHQFTWPSLLCLLNGAGFEAETMSGGHYESAVYSDSVRVVARVRKTDACREEQLVARFKQCMGNTPFLLYGIGGDFQNYVLPVLAHLPVRELLDSSPEKWGKSIAGYIVGKYDQERHHGLPILVCSVRFKAAILANLVDLGVPREQVRILDEVYGLM